MGKRKIEMDRSCEGVCIKTDTEIMEGYVFYAVGTIFSAREGKPSAGSFPEFKCGFVFPPELPVRTSFFIGQNRSARTEEGMR